MLQGCHSQQMLFSRCNEIRACAKVIYLSLCWFAYSHESLWTPSCYTKIGHLYSYLYTHIPKQMAHLFKTCIWVNINSSNRMVMIMWFLSSYLNFWHLITAVHQHWLHLSSKHYWCKHRRVPLLSSFTLLVCLLSAAARSGMLWWRHEGSAVWLIDFAVVWPAWVPFFSIWYPCDRTLTRSRADSDFLSLDGRTMQWAVSCFNYL